MTYDELCALLEARYPLEIQEEWDRSGPELAPASDGEGITGVLIGLTLTMGMIERAEALGVNLILCHHPLFFNEEQPSDLTNFKNSQLLEAMAARGIGFYALHTNFDKLEMNKALGDLLELEDREVLDEVSGIGIVGTMRESLTVRELALQLKDLLGRSCIPFTRGTEGLQVARVAVCGGSGKDLLDLAMCKGEVYLTGDVNYHCFEKSSYFNFPVLDIGHHHSEVVGMSRLARLLDQELPFPVVFDEEEDFSVI